MSFYLFNIFSLFKIFSKILNNFKLIFFVNFNKDNKKWKTIQKINLEVLQQLLKTV
jgi:hypothetical protein